MKIFDCQDYRVYVEGDGRFRIIAPNGDVVIYPTLLTLTQDHMEFQARNGNCVSIHPAYDSGTEYGFSIYAFDQSDPDGKIITNEKALEGLRQSL